MTLGACPCMKELQSEDLMKRFLFFMGVKKTYFAESVVKTSHVFWKLFQQPILKTYQTINVLNVLKQIFTMFLYVLRHLLN